MLKEVFLSTIPLKILSFLALHPDESFHEREIVRQAKISAGGANAALNFLFKQGLLKRREEGKNLLYTLDDTVPVIQHFNILNILAILEPVATALKELSRKVILFGSFARGENTKGSDVDLLIISNQSDHVRDVLEKYTTDEGKEGIKIQAVIRTTVEWMSLEKKDPTFFNEISRGIILWDKQRQDEE